MNFKYLKLTFLAITLAGPVIGSQVQAASDVHGAIELFLGLTDINGSQKSVPETVNILGEIIKKLHENEGYKKACSFLNYLRKNLPQFGNPEIKVKSAQALKALQTELQNICGTLPADMQNRLNGRINELQGTLAQVQLLRKLGLKF